MARQSSNKGIDRLPPYDQEAEQAVLGCVLLAPNESMPECLAHLRAGAESFYDLRHQEIYRHFLALYDEHRVVDVVTVRERLASSGRLEDCGGLEYLAALPDTSASPSSIGAYLEIVQKNYLLRTIIHVCTEHVARAYEVNGDSADFLDGFEAAALAIRNEIQPLSGWVNIPAIQAQLSEEYEAAYHQGRPMGLLTGFDDLDRISGGMLDQEMIVVAGLRSSGKTTIAMNVAYRVARRGIGVGILSLETSGKKIIHRMACSIGKFDGSGLLKGETTPIDAPKAVAAFSKLNRCRNKLMISEEGALTPTQISATARRMAQAGARLFIIDYLQLIGSSGRGEYERATAASKAIKNLAKQLNAPVIIISSLSRESDKADRPPKLSDLRASGQIEYDADKVWLLYSEKLEGEVRTVDLHVAKNKDGPTGSVKMKFFASQFRMASTSRIDGAEIQEEEDLPIDQTRL